MTTVIPFKAVDNVTALPAASDQISTCSSPEYTARLARLADAAGDGHSLAKWSRETILGDRSEGDALGALRSIGAAAEPATQKETAAHYAVMALFFPQQGMTEDQAGLRFKLFCTDLGDITEGALAWACKAYRVKPSNDGRQKFFPQAWELLDLARDTMRDVRMRRRGIAKLKEMIVVSPMVKCPLQRQRRRSVVDVMISICVAIITNHRRELETAIRAESTVRLATVATPLPDGRAAELIGSIRRRAAALVLG